MLVTLLMLCVQAGTAQNQIARNIKREVIQQMITDGSVDGDCVRQKGLEDLVNEFEIHSIRLTPSGRPAAYQVLGQGCAGGMYCCGNQAFWIYRRVSNRLDLIFGGEGGVKLSPLKKYSNGYADLELYQLGGPENGGATYFRFDGKRYGKR